MAEGVDRPALYEVEITLATMVDEPGPSALDEHQRRAGRDVHHGVGLEVVDLHGSLLARKTKRPRSPRPCREKPVSRSSTLRARSSAEIRITSLASGQVNGFHIEKCTRAWVTATFRNGFRPVSDP